MSVFTGRGGELDYELMRRVMLAVTDVRYGDPGPYPGSDVVLPPLDDGLVGDAQETDHVLAGPRPVRAIQITEFGGPEVLVLRDVPDPRPDNGLVPVEVSAAGVNYADTHQAENSYHQPAQLPLIPGAEVVGTTPGGDRVVALLPAGGGYAQRALVAPALTRAAAGRDRGRPGAGARTPGRHRLAPPAHEREAGAGRDRRRARGGGRGRDAGGAAREALGRGEGDRGGVLAGQARPRARAGGRRRDRRQRTRSERGDRRLPPAARSTSCWRWSGGARSRRA